MSQITTLYADKEKTDALYPRTKVSAISDDNNKSLQDLLDERKPLVSDVQVNGASIVTDNIASIPKATATNLGVVGINPYWGIAIHSNGNIRINSAENTDINNRGSFLPIVPSNLDYAVKCAMTDGKGAAWTADEQAAARERMGLSNYELILDYTTTADDESVKDVNINFEKNDYTKLFIIFDESGIEGTTYSSVRFGLLDQTQLIGNRSLANTCPGFQTNKKWKTFKCELLKGFGWIYQATSEVQLYGYISTSNVGQVKLESISGIGGIAWYGTMYAGTNIKVWGFR